MLPGERVNIAAIVFFPTGSGKPKAENCPCVKMFLERPPGILDPDPPEGPAALIRYAPRGTEASADPRRAESLASRPHELPAIGQNPKGAVQTQPPGECYPGMLSNGRAGAQEPCAPHPWRRMCLWRHRWPAETETCLNRPLNLCNKIP